mmetsp:Transcript_36536/g.103195  ORF Transcript_36536/g.103195 Transcript_36536/m.103195 type:complete len:284 (+) Transcript_36536:206-1057(+)
MPIQYHSYRQANALPGQSVKMSFIQMLQSLLFCQRVAVGIRLGRSCQFHGRQRSFPSTSSGLHSKGQSAVSQGSRRPASRATGRATNAQARSFSKQSSVGEVHPQPPDASLGEKYQMDLEPFREMVRGRKFMCTLCGKCCTGNGNVWVNDTQRLAIAQHLGISLGEFDQHYTKSYSKYDGWRLLRDKPETDHCIFLENGTECTIHPVRPTQCSTYPWWPELVASDEAWDQEQRDVCEGMSHPEAEALDVEGAAKMLRTETASEQHKRDSYKAKKQGTAQRGQV